MRSFSLSHLRVNWKHHASRISKYSSGNFLRIVAFSFIVKMRNLNVNMILLSKPQSIFQILSVNPIMFFIFFLPILGSDPKLCITFHYFSLVSFELQQFCSFSLIFLTLTLLKQRIQLFHRSLIQGYLMLLVIRFRLFINFTGINHKLFFHSSAYLEVYSVDLFQYWYVCMYVFIHPYSFIIFSAFTPFLNFLKKVLSELLTHYIR